MGSHDGDHDIDGEFNSLKINMLVDHLIVSEVLLESRSRCSLHAMGTSRRSSLNPDAEIAS